MSAPDLVEYGQAFTRTLRERCPSHFIWTEIGAQTSRVDVFERRYRIANANTPGRWTSLIVLVHRRGPDPWLQCLHENVILSLDGDTLDSLYDRLITTIRDQVERVDRPPDLCFRPSAHDDSRHQGHGKLLDNRVLQTEHRPRATSYEAPPVTVGLRVSRLGGPAG